MSEGIIIGRLKIKPRFIFFISSFFLFVTMTIRYVNRPIMSHVVQAGSMHLGYESEAVLIRDEEIYDAPEYGRVDYYRHEQEYVEKDDIVATIFKSNYQEDVVNQLYNIQEKIVNYQQKNILKGIADNDINRIETKIDTLVYEIQEKIKFNELESLSTIEKDLKTLLDQRQQLIEKKIVPDSYLKNLSEEEAKIAEQLKEWKIDITAPRIGFLSYQIDNLENILTFDSIGELNLNSYRDLINWKTRAKPDGKSDEVTLGTPFFRIVDSEKWYIACEIDYGENFFNVNERVAVSFLDFGDKDLEGIVNKVVDGSKSFLLIIEFRDDLEEFINTRQTSIILSKTVDGLVIPKDGIVERRSATGVYKIEDNKRVFIDIDILGESEDEDYIIANDREGILGEGDIIDVN